MNQIGVTLALLIAAALPMGCANPPDNEPDAIVLEYLRSNPDFFLEHPELIEQAVNLSREREGRLATEVRRRIVSDYAPTLFSPTKSPIRGVEHAPLTLIEFSDYQCIPCKESFRVLENFIETRDDARIVHLQPPIYGSQSILAAKAAVVAHQHGRFEPYHIALMENSMPVELALIRETMESLGISVDEINEGMSQPEVTSYLGAIRELAEQLGVIGTPTIIVDGAIIRGSVTDDSLREALFQVE